MPIANIRMAIEQRRRGARFPALGSSTALVALTLAGCELQPGGGYEIVSSRQKEPPHAIAAPPPPRVVEGIGGSAADVPKLAAGAPAGVTQEMVEEGAKQFGTICAACHGAGGSGTGAGPVLNDAEWLNISGGYDEIVTVINAGVPNPKQFPAPMPPRGGGNFNDEQVRALAAYVFALSHQ